MENKLKELKEKGQIVVEVIQDKKRVNAWYDEKNNVLQLLGFLYSITILKDKSYTIRYSYNYSDKQTIKVINKYTNYDGSITKTEYIFYNIPTSMGYLDTFELYYREVINNDKTI